MGVINDKQFKFTRDIGRLLRYADDCKMDLSLREVWRSRERQTELLLEGKSRTHHSEHIWSLAADFVLFRDGENITDGQDWEWRMLGEYWEALGHTWGGKWDFNDAGHFEYGGYE